MEKTIITFGSDQLEDFNIDNPMQVMLILPYNDLKARNIVFNTKGIGGAFCTSYSYEYAIEFKEKHGMYEITLEELEKLRKDK